MKSRNEDIPTLCQKKIRIDSDIRDKSFPAKCLFLVHCLICLFVFCVDLIHNEKYEFINLLKMKLGLIVLALSVITHVENISAKGKHQLKTKY